MKKVLVIGSAVADVVIRVDHLPSRSEDVNIKSQKLCLGGCAMNVYDTLRHFPVPLVPFFAVGSGVFGDFVHGEMQKRNITPVIPRPIEENGCCYCYIEPDGERTFLCYHGAEYRFYPEWFNLLQVEEIDSVYICGLEIEEETGIHILEFLENNPSLTIYFAPGPRIQSIDPALMKRLFALHPIIHLNDDEVCAYTETSDYQTGAAVLQTQTGSPVIVTLGKDGVYCKDHENCIYVPSEKVTQIDTNGAGDSHIGAVIAGLKMGLNMEQSLNMANKVSGAMIGVRGATMDEQNWSELRNRLSVFISDPGN